MRQDCWREPGACAVSSNRLLEAFSRRQTSRQVLGEAVYIDIINSARNGARHAACLLRQAARHGIERFLEAQDRQTAGWGLNFIQLQLPQAEVGWCSRTKNQAGTIQGCL